MNPHFFGDSNAPLYGVHHPPRRCPESHGAVVLCPPLGHEYVRTHWMLRLLASQMARDGVHVLRFDYFGTGDSGGSSDDVPSLDTWVTNVRQAAEQLRDESGVDQVSLLGLRMGTILAARAASEDRSIDQLLLWDPVMEGSSYLKQLRTMHRQMLDLWVCPMTTEDSESAEELLGFKFRRSLLEDIEGIRLEQVLPTDCQTLVFGNNSLPGQGLNGEGASIEESGDWDDLRTIETAMLRPKTLRSIVERFLASTPPRRPAMTPSFPAVHFANTLPNSGVAT